MEKYQTTHAQELKEKEVPLSPVEQDLNLLLCEVNSLVHSVSVLEGKLAWASLPYLSKENGEEDDDMSEDVRSSLSSKITVVTSRLSLLNQKVIKLTSRLEI